MFPNRNGRGLYFGGVFLAVAWLGYGLLGSVLSRAAATHFGAALLRIGRGKFTDPAAFVAGRTKELLLLATAALALVLALRLIDRSLGMWTKARVAAPILRGLLFFADSMSGFISPRRRPSSGWSSTIPVTSTTTPSIRLKRISCANRLPPGTPSF